MCMMADTKLMHMGYWSNILLYYVQEERSRQLSEMQHSAATLIQADTRGWLARKSLLPVLATLRTRRTKREAKHTQMVVMIQARARGCLVRQQFSTIMKGVKDEREKKREAFSKALVFTQARARGCLVRAEVKGELQRLRDARHKKWVALIALFQANCRGNLVRRVTRDALEDVRERRLREVEVRDRRVVRLQARARGMIIRRQCAVMMARQRRCKEQEKIPNTATTQRTNTTIHHHHHHDRDLSQHHHQHTSATATTEKAVTASTNTPSPSHSSANTTSSMSMMVNMSSSNSDTPTSTMVAFTSASSMQSEYSRTEVQLQERGRNEESDGSKQVTKKEVGSGKESKEEEKSIEGRRDGEDNLLEAETVSMLALARARSVEIKEAQQARQRMDAMCSTRELVDLAKEGRNRPTYIAELEHVSKPLPGPTLLGLLHDRMTNWQQMQCRKKQLEGDHMQRRVDNPFRETGQPRLAPVAGSHPLTQAQLLGASPKGTELGEVVQVMVYGSRQPLSLSSLEACPQLRSVSMTKCGLKALAGLQGCPLLTEIHMPVC